MKNRYCTLIFIISLAFSTSIKYYAFPTITRDQQGHKTQPHLIDKHKKNSLFRTDIDTTVIWSENFDYSSDQLLWLFDKGWKHTEQSSKSPTYSMLSPNNSTTQSVSEGTYETYTLFSPIIDLPNIAFYESMYFNFNIKADMCGNCDNDDFLNDYYQMDIQVGENVSFWHISDYEVYSENGNFSWSIFILTNVSDYS